MYIIIESKYIAAAEKNSDWYVHYSPKIISKTEIIKIDPNSMNMMPESVQNHEK